MCLGGGGSARALCRHLLDRPATPSHIVVCERDESQAAQLRELFPPTEPAGVDLLVLTRRDRWDEVVAGMDAGGLVVNATGLGKDRPACPALSHRATRPARPCGTSTTGVPCRYCPLPGSSNASGDSWSSTVPACSRSAGWPLLPRSSTSATPSGSPRRSSRSPNRSAPIAPPPLLNPEGGRGRPTRSNEATSSPPLILDIGAAGLWIAVITVGIALSVLARRQARQS